MEKIGRNDPCYCGSGKKYKKCHWKIDQETAREERDWENAAQFLRRDFISFAREERFAESFAAAIALFFDNLYTIENAQEMSEPESVRFFEWFTFDFTPQDRPRLIEIYRMEKIDSLKEKQKSLLEGWLTARPACAYRLIDASGQGKQTLHLGDLFDNQVYIVEQTGGPGRAETDDILIARLLPYRKELRMSGSTGFLPAAEAVDLEPYIQDAWNSWQKSASETDWDAFLRAQNYLFAHFELKAARKAGRPPVARLNPDRPKSALGQMGRRIRGQR